MSRTGKQTRCFLHVKDAVRTLINLMSNAEAIGNVYNIGSQDEITIEDLAKKIIEIAKSKSKVVYIPYDKAYEEGFEDMQRRKPDTTKVRKTVGFRPTVDLEGIIKSVVEYIGEQ
ncbi:GDP-mannose 4,6-dehydratase [Candidatus Omnitrophota bacterium]